jgi:DNA mismatch repair protein MutL
MPVPSGLSKEDHAFLGLKADMLLDANCGSVSPFGIGGVRILGQIHNSYIVACDNQGLLIIDQHVAHERILYERMASAMKDRAVEIQGLLVPLAIELPPAQIAVLEQILPELNRNGFRLERFGGNAVLVRSVPAVAGECDCRLLLIELLEGLEKEERSNDIERIRDRIAVSTACRAAIKVNMPLTMEKMQWLLDELALTKIPTNCPHGRPILLRFSLYEIERNFGRA